MSGKTETFGSPAKGYAIDQLKARATLVESNKKSKEALMAINSNVAWVSLRSSVNQISDGEVKQLLSNKVHRDAISGNAELAKKYILHGGTYTAKSGELRSGINFFGNDGNYAYTTTSLGFRPMPGITGLKVSTKNRMGTIIQAELEFVVWSPEDLENIEKLYFKPGYTCILEWGHSAYVDNSGNLQTMGKSNFNIPSDAFFSGQTGEVLDEKIVERKEAGFGNYDGMYGYIQNYNWSFRPDGGYDCSLKIMSRGQILEAMKVAKTTDNVKPEDKGEDKDKVESKSILHYCLTKLTDNDDTVMDGKKLLNDKKAKKVANKLKYDFKVFRIKQDINRSGLIGMILEKSIDLCYIRLRTFLDIINSTSVLLDNTKNVPLVKFNTDFGQKFITYPNHWSIDPIVCQKAKVPSADSKYCVTKKDLTEKMEKEVEGKEDDIMNIFISTHTTLKIIDDVLGESGENEGVGLHDVLMRMLSNIQRCFGNINQFDLYSDPEFPDTYTVVDRNNMSPDALPIIDVTGLKSTTKSIDISSKISSKISNMVAIAAQGNSGNYNENIQTLLQWNQGALDRHIKSKDASDAKQDEEENERIEKHLEELDDVFDHFNGSGWFTNQVYDGEKFAQMQNQNISYTQKEYRSYIASQGKVPQGVMPIELSLKMLGISGLKPGLSFRINKGILPAKYDNYGFIITGISHTIENNTWYTDLKTTFFPITGVPKTQIPGTSPRSAGGSSSMSAADAASLPSAEEIAGHTQANRLRAAINQAGYKEKGVELSNGGDITKQTADLGISFIKKVKQEVPGVTLIFTGGNDAYHQKLSYNSRHKSGRGLDFVVVPYSTANKNAVKKVLQGFAAGNKPNVKFIDEYANATKAATAPHFHMSWGPGTEGKRDVNEAIALAEQGKIKTYTV